MSGKIGFNFSRREDVISRPLFRAEFVRDRRGKIILKSRKGVCVCLEDVPGPKAGDNFTGTGNLVNGPRYLHDSLHPPVAPI